MNLIKLIKSIDRNSTDTLAIYLGISDKRHKEILHHIASIIKKFEGDKEVTNIEFLIAANDIAENPNEVLVITAITTNFVTTNFVSHKMADIEE